MADIYNISWDNSSDYLHILDDFFDDPFIKVVMCIIVCIGLPLTLVAIYALYSMVRNDHVAPIYIINLFITDLIQLCCMLGIVTQPKGFKRNLFGGIYSYCLMVSVGFMVSIAVERYLVIAWPLWYRFRRTIKSSVVVCVVVWVFPIVFTIVVAIVFTIILIYIKAEPTVIFQLCAVFLLLPFPLLIFSLVGTLKALSASISVPSDEKRRIVGMLVLVLLIYTLLFLPTIILLLAGVVRKDDTLTTLSNVFVMLSPLADLVLYVFMKKGTIDKLLASVCCCRMDSNDTSSPAV